MAAHSVIRASSVAVSTSRMLQFWPRGAVGASPGQGFAARARHRRPFCDDANGLIGYTGAGSTLRDCGGPCLATDEHGAFRTCLGAGEDVWSVRAGVAAMFAMSGLSNAAGFMAPPSSRGNLWRRHQQKFGACPERTWRFAPIPDVSRLCQASSKRTGGYAVIAGRTGANHALRSAELAVTC